MCDSVSRPQFNQLHYFFLVLNQNSGKIVDDGASDRVLTNFKLSLTLFYEKVFDLFVVYLEVAHNQLEVLSKFL